MNKQLQIKSLKEITLERYQEIIEIVSKIDRNDVEDELVTLAAIFGYFHGWMSRAKFELDSAVNRLETYSAALRTELRKESKKSVEAVKDEAGSREEIKELNNDIVDCEHIYNLLKGICQTMDTKKDMLIQLSANRREEVKINR